MANIPDLLTRLGIHKAVLTGLKVCIQAHGPVTPELIGSAAKRIEHCILEELKKHSIEEIRELSLDHLAVQQAKTIVTLQQNNAALQKRVAELLVKCNTE